MKDTWYIIINPKAGSGKTMRLWIPAEKKLSDLGIPYKTVFSDHRRHAVELAAIAAEAGYRKIMAVGGDGSIHEVFEGVLSWCEKSSVNPEEFYLAVAPIGSGNDWIKSFGVPNNVLKMLDLVKAESFTKEDVVRVKTADGNVSYMANIGGIGFDSHVCEKVNEIKEKGRRMPFIYLRALIPTIFKKGSFKAAFYCDGQLVYSGSLFNIGFGNGKYCGGGLQETCLADPTDGQLDAMLVPSIPLVNAIPLVPRLLNGTINKSDKIIYSKGTSFKVVPLGSESVDILEIDGDIVGYTPCEIEILPQKVNVLCGKKFGIL